MNKKAFVKLIRNIVKDELKESLNIIQNNIAVEVSKQITETLNDLKTKPSTKLLENFDLELIDDVEDPLINNSSSDEFNNGLKFNTKSLVINEILESTKGGIPKDILGGVVPHKIMPSDGMVNVTPNTKKEALIEAGVREDIAVAMTKDYRKLMKEIDKKQGRV